MLNKSTILKIAIIALFLLALMTTGCVGIQGNFAQTEIKKIIVSYVEEKMERGVSIENVKDHSLESITLSNFKIFKNNLLKDEDQIFQADEVIVKYNLDLLLALKKETVLEIEDIILVKPQMTLVRDKENKFDFLEKFNLIGDNLTFSIKKVTIKDGNLDYKDYQTTLEDGLLSKAKKVNGYLSLADLPKVEINCSAIREEDTTSFDLKGYFFINNSNYSLDFAFKDASISHFQYYFAQAMPFNLKSGLFDLNLHLANDADTTGGIIDWYGEAIARDVNFSPDFLNNINIEQANGSATFNSKKTIIEEITATYKNSPFFLTGKLDYVDDFNYEFDVKSSECKLNDLKEEAGKYLSFSTDFSLNGNSEVAFKVTGSEDKFQVNGKISANRVNILDYDFSEFSTRFDYNDNGIYLKDLKTKIAGGLIEGEGKIDLDAECLKYSFLFDLARVDLESDLLKPLVSDYLKSGTLSGNVNLNGIATAGENLNLNATLKIDNNEYGDFWFQTEGTVGKNNNLNLTLKTEGINLQRLTKSFNFNEIEGKANFIGTLNGPLDDLEINGDIGTEKIKISGVPFNHLTGKIGYQDKKVMLDGFILENENIHLKGGGEINFLKAEDKININATLQLTETDLTYLKDFYDFELPLLGMTNGEIIFQGDWPKITAKGDFKFKEFYLGDYYAESGNAIVTLKDKIVEIENMMLKSGKNVLYAKGEISLEKEFPLNLKVNFLNQNVQALLSNFVESDLLKKFKGQATGSMEIKGMIESPDFYIASIIEDVRLEGLPLNSIDLKLEKTGSTVKINRLTLKQQKGELTAEGWLNFHPDNEDMNINITANSVDLSQLSNLFNLDNEFEGLTSFTAKAEGKINSPDVSFSAQIKKAKYAEFYFDELNMEALYKQEILKIKQFVLDKEGNQIIGKGEIPYKFSFGNKEKTAPVLADLPLDFTLNMENTDLKFLKLFFNDDFKQLSGLTNLSLELSGTLKQPLLNGSITLANGEMEFYKSIPKISNLNAMIRLEDNLFKITNMDFQIDQFKMNASGELTLKEFEPQDLRIKLWSHEQKILYEDIFNGLADLDIEISGLFNSPHIKGIARLFQAELNLKENKELSFDFNKILSELTDLKGNIDLEVELTDGFIAETKDFKLHLAGNATVNGELSSPRLNGQLNVEQGYIAFLDKKFRISNGKIIFPDSLEKELILNMNAKTKIDDIDILLHLGGSPSQLSITLDSSPSLSESEIISLLMFNKNYAGLTEGELGEVLKEEMISLLAQGLSLTFLNQIENEVANTLGLDEFNIETIFKSEQNPDLNQTNRVTLAGLALKIGKYFSENFYLTYSAPLYEVGKSNLEFEYKVKDDLTLSTQIGSAGSQEDEFELKFELKYEF
ncbi:MAG: translocation/assembly module TamB domain-containing protein [Candidatus Caldatribacteriota bacterium]|nr:translocation/assembly module TamB domain-containing protein [Candidatus Caldatribacteriota bacterium]